ncbi:dihydrodipicolinate reductase C-terminal domain-containing protein [Rhodoferax sp.]|uniref:4-hydroxy-tetrahydrodipicolinate reductase n=1 Tax=Rhodoferax sp. TaxID=50421 RepID=UPI00261B60A4|nr:dihydrodipicolinate reductase C-terminal domain-containing protein [Rhodoferax sp.]MDD2925073.1 dihydrodipicolinate reductase C-terminal domain-containing protein [Rhodoferax sp.]
MIKVGLFGYGKAGRAVAQVLQADPRFDLRWIAKRTAITGRQTSDDRATAVVGLDAINFSDWLHEHPVDAMVDFSVPQSLQMYGEDLRRRKIMLVSAISAYTEEQLSYARSLGQDTRVLCSPNMTLGINFLIMAAKLLRNIAPFADVEILEQHFKEKPEVSGTAKKIAESLELGTEKITSLRLGGIVGHHEVIFGFPYQTVRLTHDSIKREAFGTGAAFALGELARCDTGFYTFEDLLMKKLREQLSVA